MSSPTIDIKVTGLAAPGGAATQTILNTFTGGWPINHFVVNGIKRCVCNIAHSHDFTFKWYKSLDGTTWDQISEQAITFSATATASIDINVEAIGSRYFKLDVLNGASAQTTWRPSLVLNTDRAAAA